MLPAADPEKITTISEDVRVQVIDILDIQTALSVQIERLEARQQNVALLPDEETGETGQQPQTTRMCKYTVRDAGNNSLFLVYTTQPSSPPTLGAVLTVRAGCDMHRGILLGTPQTVVSTGSSGPITINRLEQLRSLLSGPN